MCWHGIEEVSLTGRFRSKGVNMEGQERRNGRLPGHAGWLARVTAMVLVFTAPACGQFMMQPMKIELAPRAGERFRMDLKLQNTSVTEAHTVDLRVLDLTQIRDGEWEIIEPGSGFDTSKLSSCRDWVALQYDSVRIRPMNMLNVGLAMDVPRNARGFYAAAVHAQLRAKPDARGVAMVLNMLVPILVEIQGNPLRHAVELTDVDLQFEQKPDQPATTLVTLGVANTGGTYSHLKAVVRVSTVAGERQRRITEAEFTDRSIIPGVTLTLQSDIQRALPSGKYRLEAVLYVDGRRAKPMEKEIDFVGDPKLTRAATDAALDLTPTAVSVETVPGATRTAVLRVYNASSEAVNVKTAVMLPPILEGVALPHLKGEELDCASWVAVEPQEFNLRPQGSQSLRITTRMPNPTAPHACYYALLRLYASYADGQNAGVRNAYVCVTNKQVAGTPEAQPWPVSLQLEAQSRYAVIARFMNTGDVHFTPKCRATVTAPDGSLYRQVALSGEPANVMLPLEHRVFSEIIDFAGLPAGYYRLTVSLQYGSAGEVSTDIPILAEQQQEQTLITVRTIEDYEQKAGVKWR